MKNIADNLQTLQKQEAEFARTHKSDTDDELIAYLVKCSKELGRCPKKEDIIGHTYLKQRFGPWPRILERAGLKEKSQKRLEKEQKMNWTENSKAVINHGSLNRINQLAEKKLKKEFKKPERIKSEAEFAQKHSADTDAELYEYLKQLKAKHGKRLNPTNTIGYTYLVKRLGAWNEVMRQISMDLKNENERIETT
ncbi:MAG: hypothetical protein J6A69_08445 [Clostridia bacterium]|nr:hypothetical protein [Clostridia bacterium]